MGRWRPMPPCPYCGAQQYADKETAHAERCPLLQDQRGREVQEGEAPREEHRPAKTEVVGSSPTPAPAEFCASCGERLDPEAEGACGECGWIPSHYDDGTPSHEYCPACDNGLGDGAVHER